MQPKPPKSNQQNQHDLKSHDLELRDNRITERQNNRLKAQTARLLQVNSEQENYDLFNVTEQSILLSISQQLDKGYVLTIPQAIFIEGLMKKKRDKTNKLSKFKSIVGLKLRD